MGALFYFIITFILIQEIGFIDLFSNLKTFTGPNSAQLPFFICYYADFRNGECRPGISISMAAKRTTEILGWPSETLLYNSGLYILLINKQNSVFPQKSIYSGGLISEGAYNWRDLYISNLMSLYLVAPKTGRAYNRDFKRIYKKYIKKNI